MADSTQPIDLVGELKAPALGLYGGADQGLPARFRVVCPCHHIEKAFRHEIFQSLRSRSAGVVRVVSWDKHIAC
jgi:hypothetical protein